MRKLLVAVLDWFNGPKTFWYQYQKYPNPLTDEGDSYFYVEAKDKATADKLAEKKYGRMFVAGQTYSLHFEPILQPPAGY